MTDSSSSELLLSCGQGSLQTVKELERMVETVENVSVQCSQMAYDMVVLRTDPDHAQALQRLQDAHLLCEGAVRPHLATPDSDISGPVWPCTRGEACAQSCASQWAALQDCTVNLHWRTAL
ncbi:hypothetical protein ACEWY4_016034 [Coilia grayii]|uniref:Uncharacterized protein n=1 Tax=Coilia grayii TaxID=363190 RepID=A0ABD1JQL6_9TELE